MIRYSTVYVGCGSLTSVDIPTSVTNIEAFAFYGNHQIEDFRMAIPYLTLFM